MDFLPIMLWFWSRQYAGGHQPTAWSGHVSIAAATGSVPPFVPQQTVGLISGRDKRAARTIIVSRLCVR
jgi:hypothetical protein